MAKELAKVPHAHSGGFFNVVIDGKPVADLPFERKPDGWIKLEDLEEGVWDFIEEADFLAAETAEEAEEAGYRAVYLCDACKGFTINTELDPPDWRTCRQCRYEDDTDDSPGSEPGEEEEEGAERMNLKELERERLTPICQLGTERFTALWNTAGVQITLDAIGRIWCGDDERGRANAKEWKETLFKNLYATLQDEDNPERLWPLALILGNTMTNMAEMASLPEDDYARQVQVVELEDEKGN